MVHLRAERLPEVAAVPQPVMLEACLYPRTDRMIYDSPDEFDDAYDDYPDDAWDDDQAETIPCPECGALIYEEAEQCPECGAYVTFASRPLANWPPVLVWLAVAACVAVVWVLIWG